jgi:7-cyano-7-deazaguanine tRNA-ribosyltransferase
LHAIKLEVDKVKQAIYEGRLWEYVLKKARAHPKLYEMTEILINNSESLSISTPKFKEKAIFLYDKDDQYRPEVRSYHTIVRRFKTKKNILIITKEPKIKPGYLSQDYFALKRKFKNIESIQVCYYNPQLGLIPNEISDIFPAAHHETARVVFDSKEFSEFQKTWTKFFENNKFSEIYFDKKDDFLKNFIKILPKGIKKKSLK